MTVAIVGAGKLGTAIAAAFTRSGHDVWFASASGKDSVRVVAERTSLVVRAVTVDEAVNADVVFLALSFLQTRTVGKRRVD